MYKRQILQGSVCAVKIKFSGYNCYFHLIIISIKSYGDKKKGMGKGRIDMEMKNEGTAVA